MPPTPALSWTPPRSGPDFTKLVQQSNVRGLFKGDTSCRSQQANRNISIRSDAPTEWIVTGYPYPVTEILEQANSLFASAYSARYGEAPTMGSVVGHAMISSIVAPIEQLGSVETEAMADGFGNVGFDTPFSGSKAVRVDWRYRDGGTMLPPDAEVRKLRPAI